MSASHPSPATALPSVCGAYATALTWLFDAAVAVGLLFALLWALDFLSFHLLSLGVWDWVWSDPRSLSSIALFVVLAAWVWWDYGRTPRPVRTTAAMSVFLLTWVATHNESAPIEVLVGLPVVIGWAVVTRFQSGWPRFSVKDVVLIQVVAALAIVAGFWLHHEWIRHAGFSYRLDQLHMVWAGVYILWPGLLITAGGAIAVREVLVERWLRTTAVRARLPLVVGLVVATLGLFWLQDWLFHARPLDFPNLAFALDAVYLGLTSTFLLLWTESCRILGACRTALARPVLAVPAERPSAAQ